MTVVAEFVQRVYRDREATADPVSAQHWLGATETAISSVFAFPPPTAKRPVDLMAPLALCQRKIGLTTTTTTQTHDSFLPIRRRRRMGRKEKMGAYRNGDSFQTDFPLAQGQWRALMDKDVNR